ncbi:MAG: peptide chain release factor N(5)-glutamine methyltransferase [Bacillota bacterium]|jgi:release factor glutamine methyltransferase|nr:peptide chain release factor N(5)-glutamine methyltransferase [Bacillota bacterium]
MTGGSLLRDGMRFLKEAGIGSPRLEAEVLLAFAWGRTRTEILVYPEQRIPAGIVENFWELLKQRARGVPVAYLTGEKEFMSLSFQVNPAVLIPRPETELLAERTLEFLAGREEGHRPLVADVGTGCGALAVSLAYYNRRVRVVATDISGAALGVARANARRHGVEQRIEFLAGDLLAPLGAEGRTGRGTAVVANLPYIPRPLLNSLPRDVRYEPRIALDGGVDGLDLYRRLLPQAVAFLAPGGLLACEVDPGQARVLAGLLDEHVWSEVQVSPDYQGSHRMVTALKRKEK